MRYLAIDFGMQRIGMAVSDESALLVWPHGVHRRDNGASAAKQNAPANRRDVAAVVEAVRGLNVQGLVFGLPRALDGGIGTGEDAVRGFAAQVQNALRETNPDITIEWWDERFSTREALGQMRDLGISQKRGRQSDGASSTDARAAAVILQGFLDGKSAARQRAFDQNETAEETFEADDATSDQATPEAHAAIGSAPEDDAINAVLLNPQAARNDNEAARDEAGPSEDDTRREEAEPKDLF